ncbi:RICIN domain-containing protein [Streptomyces sp. NPDC004008]
MRLHSRTAVVAGGVVLACGLGMLPAAAASGGTAGSAMGHVRASSLASSAGNANQWWMWINSKDRCLDVPGWSTRNGTGLDAWDCRHQNNVRWMPVGPFTGRGGHTVFLIKNAHSGKCINVPTSRGLTAPAWCSGPAAGATATASGTSRTSAVP